MAEDERERLNKLAELRKSGVLSEEEYHAARARLRARSKSQEIEEVDATPSILQSYWPALVGLGILILLIIGVVLYGRMGAQDETVDLNVAVGNDVAAANVLEAAPTGNALCASTSTYLRIKDAIFDRAQKQFGGDPGPLESLRRSVGVRMQYPLLRGVHQDINRTDCGGRLILDLPPAARAAFDSVPALESDIQFSVQPSADGNGDVVEVSGGDDVVQQLSVAAGLVYARRAQAGTLPQKIYNPSFDCGGSLSNVERMICSDEQLSQLDRALAARYQALKQEFSAAEWQQVVDSQRDFLRRRAACADVACLHDAYVAQGRFLDRLNDAYQAAQ